MEKSADAFRTISEVADDLELPQHVLRFWETRFPHIRPLKRAGGRRYYRPTDVTLLRTIRQLLYDDGYTIKGVQRLLKEQGARNMRVNGVPVPVDRGGAEDADPAFAEAKLVDSESAEPAEDQEALPRFGSALLQSDRQGLEQTLATIDECARILEALRRPGR